MLSVTFKRSVQVIGYRCLSSIPVSKPNESYPVVVVGGGAGGISVAARLNRYFKKPKSVAVIEPKDVHYYQPMFTLVGAGLKDLSHCTRDMSKIMPQGVDWIKEKCIEINPEKCEVKIDGSNDPIKYSYLVMAAGIHLDFDKVQGLPEALKMPDSRVCSNYSPDTVNRTWDTMQKFKEGHAIFTFPNSPVKCAGAPQKIMYLTDAFLKKNGRRANATISYHTSLPSMMSSAYYAEVLLKLCNKRNLQVYTRTNLVKVDPDKRIAYFQNLDKPEEKLSEFHFEMLHVTPPMSAPKFQKALASDASNGFVAVHHGTLQHVKYPNVFALGDCSSLPTSKTAAAIASQNYILARNLEMLMESNGDTSKCANKFLHYDGYTSCPVVTGNNKCILAEFDYTQGPKETFPISQAKERTTMYYMKRDVLPFVYWNAMLKGKWAGPSTFRKLFSFGAK